VAHAGLRGVGDARAGAQRAAPEPHVLGELLAAARGEPGLEAAEAIEQLAPDQQVGGLEEQREAVDGDGAVERAGGPGGIDAALHEVVLGKRGEAGAQPARVGYAVGVGEGEHVAGGDAHAGVASGAGALAGPGDDDVDGAVGGGERAGPVAGVVVDDDQLEALGQVLRGERVEQRRQRAARVAGRDDHADHALASSSYGAAR